MEGLRARRRPPAAGPGAPRGDPRRPARHVPAEHAVVQAPRRGREGPRRGGHGGPGEVPRGREAAGGGHRGRAARRGRAGGSADARPRRVREHADACRREDQGGSRPVDVPPQRGERLPDVAPPDVLFDVPAAPGRGRRPAAPPVAARGARRLPRQARRPRPPADVRARLRPAQGERGQGADAPRPRAARPRPDQVLRRGRARQGPRRRELRRAAARRRPRPRLAPAGRQGDLGPRPRGNQMSRRFSRRFSDAAPARLTG